MLVSSNRGIQEGLQAVGYLRVSTAGQATDGVSLDAQRSRIASWCDVHGYTLATLCEDAGASGGRADNRPGLHQALDRACALKAALVVYSLSRLARSTRDALAISDRLDKAGADLVSLSERIDTTTAAGKMVFRMLAVLSEFEADQIAERTSTALQHMKANGFRVGSVPFGFDLDDDGKTLVPVDHEQETIGLIRRLRDDGLTLRAIADELADRGIGTKTGKPRWAPKVIAGILRNHAPAPEEATRG